MNVSLCDQYQIHIKGSTGDRSGQDLFTEGNDLSAMVFGGIKYGADNAGSQVWNYLEGTKVEGEAVYSILEKAKENIAYNSIRSEDAQYIGPEEALLLKKMAALRSILRTICQTNQTHLLTYYVLELANIFHSYYSKHRVMEVEHIQRSRGRLLLIAILKDTFETVLELLGISRPEKM